MDFASALLQLVKDLGGLAKKHLGCIYLLKDNVHSLKNANEELKAVSADVKARVEHEERGKHAPRTEQVANWLSKVQEFVSRTDQVLQDAGERDQIKCLSRCLPPNCWSGYKLGKRVHQMLNEARNLQSKEGEFNGLTSPSPPPVALAMPMGETVGLDSSLKKVWEWLVDEKQVEMIGLYGIGGVGKTTLMKRINNELSPKKYGFDAVIWVVVSRQVNEDRIQDDVRKGLGITDELWKGWSGDERVHHLWQDLNMKKFVLLIDDLWGRLDLPKIGVPRRSHKNGSKVVFTTRSEQVCRQMGADKTFKVQCLTPEEALELFENNVGKSIVNSHPKIPDLAKDIVQECGGLPLALITVGQAMAGIVNPREWDYALAKLKKNPYKLSGMEEEVYRILEFSYDQLKDPTLQRCFLYCCLFPEDYHIRPHDLIGLWIGEGLLGDTSDVYSLRNEGEHFLGRLNRACLLESGHDYDGREYVKMHDVIRDMATWIARDHGQRENKWLVIEREADMSEEMISKWGEAEKVSVWGKWIRNIYNIPSQCPQLEILFVRETEVTVLPSGFFDSMTARLTVLNLSENKHIKSFPEGICNLINLRYLNLSGTDIEELPKEIKNLTRLRWLLLDNISKDILIPTRAITSLPLNVFSCWSYQGSFLQSGQVKEEETVEELGCTKHLTDLSIHVRESSSTQKIFQSMNLRGRMRRVCINNTNGNLTSIIVTYSPASTHDFSHLEMLYLSECTNLSEMKITQGIRRAPNCSCFPNLVEVDVTRCGLSDLSWLMHAPKLRKLTVEGCKSMERIIGDGFARDELAASRLFSCLESLILLRLPKLTSICDQTLCFPQRVRCDTQACPDLKKLPLDSSSARGSFEVEADDDWWAEFEWDPTARVTLQLVGESLIEEMTFRKAVRETKKWRHRRANIGLILPRGGLSERAS